jgi:hypothetical protein
MKHVIEFPRHESEKDVEFPRPVTSPKIVNIAEWTLRYQIQIANSSVDNWPFCAA